jgi:hypothetical protein
MKNKQRLSRLFSKNFILKEKSLLFPSSFVLNHPEKKAQPPQF